MENLGEKCGVFGVYEKGLDAARLSFFGLYALQHRGQESSGLATSDEKNIFCHKKIYPIDIREKIKKVRRLTALEIF